MITMSWFPARGGTRGRPRRQPVGARRGRIHRPGDDSDHEQRDRCRARRRRALKRVPRRHGDHPAALFTASRIESVERSSCARSSTAGAPASVGARTSCRKGSSSSAARCPTGSSTTSQSSAAPASTTTRAARSRSRAWARGLSATSSLSGSWAGPPVDATKSASLPPSHLSGGKRCAILRPERGARNERASSRSDDAPSPMTCEAHSTVSASSEAADAAAPGRAGLVLVSLILVAAVANLNLAVANVALPSIGKAFDASQTALESRRRRLLARPRRIGALLRRARRPLRAQADAGARHGAVDPRLPARRVRAERRGPLRGARARRALGRHGLPDDARTDHGALVGPGPNEVDRALVGHRRRDLLARARCSRVRCSSTSGGGRSS